MDLSYIINCLGEYENSEIPSIAPPLVQTSNFFFKNVEDFRKSLQDEKGNLIYTRGNNPTVEILNKKLATLEGTDEAITLSSGMAAISTAVIANVKAGEHVICVQKPYSWTYKLFVNLLSRFNVEYDFVDGKDIKNIENKIKQNTSLVFLESPNSLTFELQDLKAIATLCKSKNITTIIDNSYCTPLNQNPHKLGIDIVVHSATKYIGGHSDTIAGIICCSSSMMDKIFRNDFLNLGGIISPFNAWLLLRGLRTLQIRLEKIGKTTIEVVQFLEKHEKVTKVHFPFSENHPQYALAKQQMKAASGLFSFESKTKDISKIEKFCNHLKYFKMAVSWGGYESLVFPTCAYVNEDSEQLPINLIRLSIGLEESEVLINDLEEALTFI